MKSAHGQNSLQRFNCFYRSGEDTNPLDAGRKKIAEKAPHKVLCSVLLTSLFYLCIPAIGESLVPAQSDIASASASASTAAIAPMDSSEASESRYWEDFLNLCAQSDADITAKDLEHAFGHKVVRTVIHTRLGDTTYYEIVNVATLMQYTDVLNTGKYGQKHNLYQRRWELDTGFANRNPKRCITRTQVLRDLAAAGWRLGLHISEKPITGDIREGMPYRTTPAYDTFRKSGHGVLSVSYYRGTECLAAANIGSRK